MREAQKPPPDPATGAVPGSALERALALSKQVIEHSDGEFR